MFNQRCIPTEPEARGYGHTSHIRLEIRIEKLKVSLEIMRLGRFQDVTILVGETFIDFFTQSTSPSIVFGKAAKENRSEQSLIT